MINEKVPLVLISLAKLIAQVELGFSRSADKIREMLQTKPEDISQFLSQSPVCKLYPSQLISTLKSISDLEESKVLSNDEPTEEEEIA